MSYPCHVVCLVGILGIFAQPAVQAEERPIAPPADPTTPQQNESYRLAPRDVIRVRVFREDELTTEARIDKNGTIIFPLIGNVRIVGQTPQQASLTIKRQLAEYLVDPQVSLSVVEYAKRRFTILGQVGRPGAYEMPDDTTVNLLEAIGMAGGYTRIAQPSSVVVKRIVNSKEVMFKLNAKSMAKDKKTEIFQIIPGDTITVGESLF